MLKRLTIRNFKAIQDMTIEFTSLTVLIGENNCGKSTVLQAIDFLRSAVFRDIPEYLREKGWNFEKLKTQKFNNESNSSPIEFISFFEFTVDDKVQKVEWDFSVDFQDGKWKICENICNNNESILGIGNEPRIVSGQKWEFPDFPFSGIKLESSALKIMDDFFFSAAFGKEVLLPLKKYLSSSAFFGVISPDYIRLGEKNVYFDRYTAIGDMALVRYINDLSKESKEKLNAILSGFIGNKVEIDTMFDKNQNLMLFARERIGNVQSTIHASHISDGLLRLTAFTALAVQPKQCTGMVLLDEIENGINPYLTEQVVSLFRDIMNTAGRQVIITTHSPVILNEFNQEEIVFLWRDEKGFVQSKNFFDTEEMRESLSFLNPGEIWENFGKETILTKLGIKSENIK